MRLDVVTIFPEYLSPLDVSLIGKARQDGLIDLEIHDLRDFTHDRHRTFLQLSPEDARRRCGRCRGIGE